jgi:hypothetical protein
MSSAEFHVIRGWQDRGWPLRVVLRGIQDCAQRKKLPLRATVLYVSPAVKEAFSAWRQRQTL